MSTNQRFKKGYPKKQQATSVYYTRESTANSATRPQLSRQLSTATMRRDEEDETLLEKVELEKSMSILSRTMSHQSIMKANWRERVEKIGTTEGIRVALTLFNDFFFFLLGTAALKNVIKFHEKHEHVEHNTLMDPTDRIKYSGSTAYIIHSQSKDDLQFKLMMEKIHSKIPYALRFRQLCVQLGTIKRKLRRDQTLRDGILMVANTLRKGALDARFHNLTLSLPKTCHNLTLTCRNL